MLNPLSVSFQRNPTTTSLEFNILPAPFHWSRQVEWPWVLRNGEFTKDQVILEVGGGHSILKFSIAKRVKHLICSEYESEYAPKILNMIKPYGFNNINIQSGIDVKDLPYNDNVFDSVVCVSTLEHIKENRELALDEMIRVLKPGGKFLFTMDVREDGEYKAQSHYEGDFFLDVEGAYSLLNKLNININTNKPNMIRAQLPDGKNGLIQLFVLMVCYIKA